MMKKLTKPISIILTIAYLLMIPASAFGSVGSVSVNTADSLLSKWQSFGLVDKSLTNSNLNDSVQKVDFVKLINGIMKPAKKADISFIDVQKEAWYGEEISKAVAAGYIDNKAKAKFSPFSDITRLQAAVMVKRVFGLKLVDKRILNKIKDAETISSEELEDFAAVIEKGCLSEIGEGRYAPTGVLKLSDALKMLDACVGQVITKPGTISYNVSGNMLVNSGDVALEDMNIFGDLTIGEGVGEGNVRLDSVSVSGKLVIRGGGPNSVTLVNTKIGDVLIIDKSAGNVHVKASGNTTIDQTLLKSGCVLEESNLTTGMGFVDVTAEKSAADNHIVNLKGEINKLVATDSNMGIKLDGKAENVEISKGANSNFTLSSGSAKTITSKAAKNIIEILGGNVTTINIDKEAIGNKLNINGKTKIDEINLREDTTVSFIKGNVERLTLDPASDGSEINISSGAYLKNMVANAAATITGSGSITNAYVYVPNVSMGIKPSGEYIKSVTDTTADGTDSNTNTNLPKLTISNVFNRTIALGSNNQKINGRASNGAELFYSSADNSIVTVGEKGELTGVSVGTTNVYATAQKAGYAPAVVTITVKVVSDNVTSTGKLEVVPENGRAGEVKDIALIYTTGEDMTNGRIIIKLPAGFKTSETDKFSINNGAEAALTKAHIIDVSTISFNNIALASDSTVKVILKNREIPIGDQFEFGAVVDADGSGPKLPAGEVSCIFTCDSLKLLQGNGINYTTPEYGSAPGTTRISTLAFTNVAAASKWIISENVTVPVYNDIISGTQYTAGQNIAVTAGQQLLLAAVDAADKVKAYAVITIEASMIRPDDAGALDPSTISVEPGIRAGTVRLGSLNLVTGANAWMIKVQNTPSSAILVDSKFDGAPYNPGDDITASEYQYIVLAAVDSATSNKVKAYVNLPVAGKVSKEAEKLVNGTNYKGPVNGTTPGAILLDSLSAGGYGITGWKYAILSKPAVIPAKGAPAAAFEKYTENNNFSNYAEKDNIFVTAGQHVLLVGTDAAGNITAYADITVLPGMIRQQDAPRIPAANVVGPVMGSTAGTISITASFNTPVAGATGYKYKFQDSEFKPAPQLNSSSDGFSALEKDLKVTGNYLILVAVDNGGLIKAYTDIAVDPGLIRPADAYLLKVANNDYTRPVPGTTVGAISLSLNEAKIEADIGKQISQWWYKLSDKDSDNPYAGSELTGSMTAYVPGQNIGNVSPQQYLLMIAVDGSGKTIAYLKEQIQYTQIKQPDAALLKSSSEVSTKFNYSVPEPGDKNLETKIKILSFWGINGAYAWRYKIADAPEAAPGYNSAANGTYVYNANLSILVPAGKYLVLYAVDDHNNKSIKAYANILISEIQTRTQELVLGHNYKIATGSAKGTIVIPFVSFADLEGTPPYTGWSWMYAVENSKFSVPGRGTKASDIPGITNFVSTTSDIAAADGQYLLLVAVDENGYVKAFANILIGSGVSNPGDAELILPAYYHLTKGSVEGTTHFDVLNMGISGQTKWVYIVKSTGFTTPVKKDVSAYTLGTGAKDLDPSKDIPVEANNHILLLATDKDGKVKGYADITVGDSQIQAPYAVDLISKAATYSGPSKGSEAGSTKISLRITADIPQDSGTIIWKYQKGTSQFAKPHLNDNASSGTGYADYKSEADIPMIKAGEYLIIAAVSQYTDGSEKIKAYLQFKMNAEWIRPAEVAGLQPDNYDGPYPGSEPGTTKLVNLELFDLTNCQWKVKVTGADDKIFEDTQFTGTAYTEGDNIAVMEGQYVVLAAVDKTSGKAKAYKNILINDPNYLNAPALKAGDNYTAPKWGVQEGTTALYVSPKGLAGNIVFVAKVVNNKENIVAQSPISYTSPAGIDFSTYKVYTANSDIAVKAGQYLLIAAVDADSKKIVAYTNIGVAAADIMPESADLLVVDVNYKALQPGAAVGSTRIPLIGFDGVTANTWLVKVVSAPLTAVALNSVDKDAKGYVTNADILVKPGDYIVLYAAEKVGTEYRIKAYACLPVTAGDIRGAAPELVMNTTPVPGTVLNTTSVVTSAVTLPTDATILRYLVGSSPAGTILKDSKMSDLPVYASGSNIVANEGQYLLFVATDNIGYVKAVSKETKLTADMIKNVVVTLGGTVFPTVSETDIAAGGKTITISLDSAEWVDNAVTDKKTVLLGSLKASGTEASKWTSVMNKVTFIEKVDSKTISIKLSEAVYDILANQQITAVIPAELIKGAVAPAVSKDVINVAAESGVGIGLTVSGSSVTSLSQKDIKAGTAKIIITLTGGGKFASDVDSSADKKNAVMAGLKATYNTSEWSNVIAKATMTLNSETKLTIALQAVNYEPLGSEVISVTIPAKVSSGYIIDGAVNDAVAATKITIYSDISAALTGTLVSSPVTEADIVAGNGTLVITLTNGKWASDITSNATVSKALFDGLTVSPTVSTNDTSSWKNKVLAILKSTDIKINSDTEIEIKLPAATGYAISADQNIVVNIPSVCIAGGIKDKLIAPQSIKITNIAPAVPAVVKNVSVSGSTTEFKLGDKILINVEFDTAVDVTGAPKITLNTGKDALYKGKAAANILTFEYTVVTGDNTTKLDYKATSSLVLNSGTIKNGETAAKLTLPAVGKTGSMSDPLKTPIVVDAFAPKFSVAPKQTATKAEISGDVTYTINETGKVYYVVMVNDGTTTVPPTVQQIVDWNTSPGALVIANGIDSASAGVSETINITGLAPNTKYNVYMVAEDALQNRATTVTSCTVQTIDKTPPKVDVISVAPSDYSVSLVVKSDEIGNIFVVAKLHGATAPTNSELTGSKIKAVVDSTNVNSNISINVTGVEVSKDYDIYVAGNDKAATPNLSAATKVQATTKSLDLTKVDVDLANKKLLNTNKLMQYSLDGLKWTQCGSPETTNVDFGYTDDTASIKVYISETLNPANPVQIITLGRGDDTAISRAMLDYDIAAGTVTNKTSINLEFKLNDGAWKQLKANAVVSAVAFEPGTLYLRLAATSPTTAGSRDAKLPSIQKDVDGIPGPGDPPTLTVDDNKNEIVGLNTTYQYSIDGGVNWTSVGAAVPTFPGTKKVLVRLKATDSQLPSKAQELTFTANLITVVLAPATDTQKVTVKITFEENTNTPSLSKDFIRNYFQVGTWDAGGNRLTTGNWGTDSDINTVSWTSANTITITYNSLTGADLPIGDEVRLLAGAAIQNAAKTSAVYTCNGKLAGTVPQIKTIKAVNVNDNSSFANGDKLVITFDQATNVKPINTSNLAGYLILTDKNGYSTKKWSTSGGTPKVTLNWTSNNELTIIFNDVSDTNLAVGDKIRINSSWGLKDASDTSAASTSTQVITGSFTTP